MRNDDKICTTKLLKWKTSRRKSGGFLWAINAGDRAFLHASFTDGLFLVCAGGMEKSSCTD